MASLTALDLASRSGRVAKKWVPKKDFHPGGSKGKLHREMGIPEGQKIPADKLAAAAHSDDPEKRRDAIRAQTMKKWHHGAERRRKVYSHPTSHKD